MTEYAALTLHSHEDLTLGDLFADRAPSAELTIIGRGEGTVYTLPGSAQPPGTMDCPVTVTAPRTFGEHAGQLIEVWTVHPDEHRVEHGEQADVEVETAVAGTTGVEIEAAGQAAVEVEVEAAAEAEPATAAQARIEHHTVVVDVDWQALLGKFADSADEEPAAYLTDVQPDDPPADAPDGGRDDVADREVELADVSPESSASPRPPAAELDAAVARPDGPAGVSSVAGPAPAAGEPETPFAATQPNEPADVSSLAEPAGAAELDPTVERPDGPAGVRALAEPAPAAEAEPETPPAAAQPDERTSVSGLAEPAPAAEPAAQLPGAHARVVGGPATEEPRTAIFAAGFLEAHGVRLLKIAGGVTGALVAMRRLARRRVAGNGRGPGIRPGLDRT